MAPIILLAIEVIVIVIMAVVLFWVLQKIGLPEPAALIARCIIGLIILGLLLGLFVPSLGIGLRLAP